MASGSLVDKIKLIKSNSALFAKFNAQVDVFKSLCSTFNMRMTAKSMHISLGGVSYKLKTIENLLGAKLFVRKGRGGLMLTDGGKELQEYLKTGFFSKEKISNTENRDENVIRISSHPLASPVYVVPAIKKFASVGNGEMVNIIIAGRENGLAGLLAHKVDILVYPLEWSSIAYYQNDVDFIKVKPYNLVLYMNKENIFSNKKIDELTWNDAMKMNIVPRNENVQFSTANSFLNSKNDNKESKMTTTCIDTPTMYKGLIENTWTMATGDEFEKIFDCSKLISKRISSRQEELGIVVNWFVCTRKDKTNDNREAHLKKIANQIAIEIEHFDADIRSATA